MLLVIWELMGKNDGFSSSHWFYRTGFRVTATGGEGTGVWVGLLKNKGQLTFMTKENGASEATYERVFILSVLVKIYDGSSFPFICSHLPLHQPPPPLPPPNTSLTCESEGFTPAQVQNTPSIIPHYLLALLFCLHLCLCIYFFLHLSFFYHFLSCYFFLSCWTLLPFFSHVFCSSLALSSPQARY